DISAWVLMGLPTSVYALGIGQVWIAVGLAVGYTLSWIFEAGRLRKFSIVSGDAITIPQYLSNRFMAKSYSLQVICAVIFMLAYTIYAASSIKACGTLFHKVIGMDATKAMYLSAIIIVSYTFLGGFSAVCWTDFFQGMLILGAMLLAPIFAVFMLNAAEAGAIPEEFVGKYATSEDFWKLGNWKDIASGFGWGLGYFGMPHIIIRFMSIKSQKTLRKSSVIGILWTLFILIFATVIGIVGRKCIGFDADVLSKELVFVHIVRTIFPGVISGVLLSAVLAAAMSTADSQLLAASSSFSSDLYKPVIRKGKTNDQELLWNGRLVVLIVALAALLIATNPNSGSIMGLVSNAWGVFGAAFGPAILLSLFWKRFNFTGAVAGIVVGAAVDIVWFTTPALAKLGLYEIIPGFFAGLVAAIAVALATHEPDAAQQKLFDDAVKYED
ncbi:MAG: sodium/proline symporter, partial [Victivallales bacterium]|nr:sodium/proline symporter [Victivallales bacterium]